MDLIQSVSHTWSATIRMFPNNSRSAIPVKTKTKKIYFTLYLQQRSHRFHLAPCRTFTTEIQMAHLDRSPLLTPSSREASKQSFTRVSSFAHVLQLIYVRNSSTTHLARSENKKQKKTRITLYLLLFVLVLCTENPAQSLGWQLEMVTWVSWTVH